MNIESYYHGMGWFFVAVAGFFALGLNPAWGRRFYPTAPNFKVRLAAPGIFLGMALGCFAGIVFLVLCGVSVLGLALLVSNRRKMARG
jgi:hypothetical protein